MKFWEEIRSLPSLPPHPKSGRELLISFLIPAHNCGAVLERTVVRVWEYLRSRYPDDFEIIIIPNGKPLGEDRTYEISKHLMRRFSEVRTVPHISPRGKGAALRTGYAQSFGKWVLFMDADCPYGFDFFSEASRLLSGGVDFVTGNRRLLQSHFDIPVSLLHLAYRRHCLGLSFNLIVRYLYGIATTDTQAGIKAMSRRMAEVAFSRQSCPGFFFDVEFFLCCTGFHFSHVEVPVTLFLNNEKSTIQLFRECLLAGIWLIKIFWKNRRGGYTAQEQKYSVPPEEVQASLLNEQRNEPTADQR
jgi:glycosyltransferase involved in cell wall biosynthesis